jgi:hypothetical protein
MENLPRAGWQDRRVYQPVPGHLSRSVPAITDGSTTLD